MAHRLSLMCQTRGLAGNLVTLDHSKLDKSIHAYLSAQAPEAHDHAAGGESSSSCEPD